MSIGILYEAGARQALTVAKGERQRARPGVSREKTGGDEARRCCFVGTHSEGCRAGRRSVLR